MLAIRGITWEPGEAHAALTPGMTAGDAAAIWRKARNLAATHLGAITAEATDGRPAGEAIRPEDAPGRRWVTARRDWGPETARCPSCQSGAIFNGMTGTIPSWLCTTCGRAWTAVPDPGDLI